MTAIHHTRNDTARRRRPSPPSFVGQGRGRDAAPTNLAGYEMRLVIAY